MPHVIVAMTVAHALCEDQLFLSRRGQEINQTRRTGARRPLARLRPVRRASADRPF